MWKSSPKEHSYNRFKSDELGFGIVYHCDNGEYVTPIKGVGTNYVGINGKFSRYVILVLSGERIGAVYGPGNPDFYYEKVSDTLNLSW